MTRHCLLLVEVVGCVFSLLMSFLLQAVSDAQGSQEIAVLKVVVEGRPGGLSQLSHRLRLRS